MEHPVQQKFQIPDLSNKKLLLIIQCFQKTHEFKTQETQG